jgi:murein DD-endopeptidase MepM/ murein hydrolase activator NlpD
MRRVLGAVLLLLVVAGAAVWWLKFEHEPPQATLRSPSGPLGAATPIEIEVRSDAPGLRSVLVRLRRDGQSLDLAREFFPAYTWRGSGVTSKTLRLQPDLSQLGISEGQATLEVFVETHAWRLGPPPAGPLLSTELTIDLVPPRLELLTRQHNVRLGGVELAVFRQSADTVSSGVQVEDYFFPATVGYFSDRDVALAFFAVPQDLSADVQPRLKATDAVGNERSVALPVRVQSHTFRHRTLQISDRFLERKVPELEAENGLPPSTDLVQGYLRINGELRRENDARLRALASASWGTALWDGSFHEQPNAAALSAFADRRTYVYGSKAIDQQTHLGYDLASYKLSTIEAAQNGVVIFADRLGIYGNTVVLDHGLGIFSLYGHLSAISVKPGDSVSAKQPLGQSGETGLAGGDHLHFSVMLYGVHVDPVEWWDARWMREHVTAKLTMLPRSAEASKREERANHDDEQG